MNEEKARALLKDFIQPNNDLDDLGFYIHWRCSKPNSLVIDNEHGTLTPELLDAISWWIHNKAEC